MNITDVAVPDSPKDFETVVRAIFAQQRSLMDKYQAIEHLPAPPISVHHASGQRVLKDFAWRYTEELAESAEAYQKHAQSEHWREELADATHFLVELLIFAGITADQCLADTPTFSAMISAPTRSEMVRLYWDAVYSVGIAMNFLRNKPWKQSQVPTDEARFRTQLLDAWRVHVALWGGLGMQWDDWFAFYFRKAKVNEFRQRSSY